MVKSKQDIIAQLEKDKYKSLIANWISYRIMLYHNYGNTSCMPSYNEIYNTSFDTISLTKEDEEDIYKLVDKQILRRLGLFMPTCDRNKPICIIDRA